MQLERFGSKKFEKDLLIIVVIGFEPKGWSCKMCQSVQLK